MNKLKKIDVYMCSLWRNGHMIKSVNSLLLNPEVGTITVTCNNYTDEQWKSVAEEFGKLPSELNSKITIIRGNNEKKSNEKLRFIGTGSNQYICFADDDLIYPPNYFEYMIAGVDRHNAYCSLHGAILNTGYIKSYYRDRQVYRGLKAVHDDLQVDIASNCGSVFKRSFFGSDELSQWYDRAGDVSMDDIYTNYFCKLHGIPRYVLAHEEGFIKHKIQEEGDNYVFDEHALVPNGDKVQTDFINRYFNSINEMNKNDKVEKDFKLMNYWDTRYLSGGNSGAGSYGAEAQVKASIINAWINEYQMKMIFELGCGDGNNLMFYNIPISYVGYDISKKAIDICNEKTRKIKNSLKYYFTNKEEEIDYDADVCLCLDVWYHQINDADFTKLCETLFTKGNWKYVIVYSTDTDVQTTATGIPLAPHVKYRKVLDTVKEFPNWELEKAFGGYTTSDGKTVGFPENKVFYLFKRKIA